MARRTAEEAQRTRERLLRVGRTHFAAEGFDGASAEAIVEAAGLTRGALYHHFDGKAALFEGVLEQAMREIHDRLQRAGARAGDPLLALRAGIHELLRAFGEPSLRRIVLVDGPAVLGWQRWREMDLRFGLGLLKRALAGAMAAGLLPAQPVDVVAQLVAGAVLDAAMLIGNAPPSAALRGRVETALWRLILHGLASGPPDAVA